MNDLWNAFATQWSLTEKQLNQFKLYYDMLTSANELFNLTAITELKSVLAYHFSDSLMLGLTQDMKAISCIGDVGTGAGFPAIPLKIKYPHLKIVLIEVTLKKITFLQQVTQKLELEDCYFESIDWRTFLRKTDYNIDIFTARASLQPEELMRVFQPSSVYRDAQLVYWAAKDFKLDSKIESFYSREYAYSVGSRKRKLIFFKSVQ